jgi:hypothetical protein
MRAAISDGSTSEQQSCRPIKGLGARRRNGDTAGTSFEHTDNSRPAIVGGGCNDQAEIDPCRGSDVLRPRKSLSELNGIACRS